MHAPPWDPILLFLHTFSPKSAHIRGPCPPTGARPPPPQRVHSPLREILDLPLIIMCKYTDVVSVENDPCFLVLLIPNFVESAGHNQFETILDMRSSLTFETFYSCTSYRKLNSEDYCRIITCSSCTATGS